MTTKKSEFRNNHILLLSFAGVIEGVILFDGDMLYYYYPVSGSDYYKTYLETMGAKPRLNLLVGTMLGPLSSILLSLGSFTIFYVLKDKYKVVAYIILISLVVMFVYGGTYHSIYAFNGFITEIHHNQIGALVFNNIYLILESHSIAIYISGSLAVGLFIFVILFNKTVYPKWIIFFTPLNALLIGYLYHLVPYPLGSILVGGWVNLCITFFFMANFYALKRAFRLSNSNNGSIKNQ